MTILRDQFKAAGFVLKRLVGILPPVEIDPTPRPVLKMEAPPMLTHQQWQIVVMRANGEFYSAIAEHFNVALTNIEVAICSAMSRLKHEYVATGVSQDTYWKMRYYTAGALPDVAESQVLATWAIDCYQIDPKFWGVEFCGRVGGTK